MTYFPSLCVNLGESFVETSGKPPDHLANGIWLP